MGWLFGKKEKHAGASLLHTDIHSHLIPGIDDGAKDMSKTIELVRDMHDLGYSKLIITPHVREDVFENDPSTFESRLEQVQQAVTDEGIDMQFEVGAEHTMDDLFARLKAKKNLKTFHDGYILLEFPFFNLPIRMKENLFDLQLDGYKLILAHPERYASYLAADKKTIETLKEREVLFQMNIASLIGHYGKEVEKFAKYLVKNDYVELLGSDLHHKGHIEMMKYAFKQQPVIDLISSGKLINNQF
ncbi:MAG: capsular biosynthesis protein [Bacteroidales bacterium]|nr:capsular biosynthesis protein [Bacteroidales bacterium]